MKKLEVFFDFNCPYCLKGHMQLMEIMPKHPGLEIVWRPCEIRVLKKAQGRTDLLQQAMHFAADNGVDLWKFHELAYDVVFSGKTTNTGDVDSVADYMKDLLDAADLRQALVSGKYAKMVDECNDFAFVRVGVHVVPTYRADDGCLQDRQEFFNMDPSDTGYGGVK